MASHESQPDITLYRGFRGSGAYTWSPFVTKLEARLRFAGLSYHTEAGSLLQAPKGKIPYVAISRMDSGPMVLGDSTLIARKLIGDGLAEDLNANLSPTERAHDLAIRALLEEKLYFCVAYERWHENYYTMRAKIFEALPYPAQVLVGLLAYRKTMKTAWGQGIGRLSPEEIHALVQETWENINALLIESKRKKTETSATDATFWILGGSKPSEADAALFGFIVSALVCTAGPRNRKVVKSFPVLESYARAIHDRYFPDYSLWE